VVGVAADTRAASELSDAKGKPGFAKAMVDTFQQHEVVFVHADPIDPRT